MMWDPDTNGVMTQPEVIWLKHMLFEHKVKVEPFNMTEEDNTKVEGKMRSKLRMILSQI